MLFIQHFSPKKTCKNCSSCLASRAVLQKKILMLFNHTLLLFDEWMCWGFITFQELKKKIIIKFRLICFLFFFLSIPGTFPGQQAEPGAFLQVLHGRRAEGAGRLRPQPAVHRGPEGAAEGAPRADGQRGASERGGALERAVGGAPPPLWEASAPPPPPARLLSNTRMRSIFFGTVED